MLLPDELAGGNAPQVFLCPRGDFAHVELANKLMLLPGKLAGGNYPQAFLCPSETLRVWSPR